MVTRKASKPAGRGVSDDEVKTPHHDDVLSWLIESLSPLVAGLWRLSDERTNQIFANARTKAKDWTLRFSKDLQEFAQGKEPAQQRMYSSFDPPEELSKVTRATLAQAADKTKAVVKKIESFSLADDFWETKVARYEVMKPVQRIERRPNGEIKRDEAGFIDLEALVFKPNNCEFAIEGIDDSYSSRKNINNIGTNADFQTLAKAFDPSNVDVACEGQQITVWMSVRTGVFTLGEILQELKVLRTLGNQSQTIALVVDGIDPKTRTHIEREDFIVIDKRDHPEVDS